MFVSLDENVKRCKGKDVVDVKEIKIIDVLR